MVEGNYIGVDADAMLDLGNSRHGVFVSDAPGNSFGGTSFAAANVISGNDELGVYLVGEGTSGNTLTGNFIGTDAFGASAIANTGNGILLDRASGNTIGTAAIGARNVISGNGRNGVELINGSSGNSVQGNYIGVDVTGSTALGNATDGLVIAGSGGNAVGSAEPLGGNIISGNGGNGVIISFGASGNVFFGNRVGADITGTVAIGNASNGILIANAAAADLT
jgi:hypothetical protein